MLIETREHDASLVTKCKQPPRSDRGRVFRAPESASKYH